MQSVHFTGYVEPRNLKLTLENVTPIVEKDRVTGVTSTFTLGIFECVLSVECETDDLHKIGISRLYTRSHEIARTAVNLVSLKMGWGLLVHIDTFIPTSGTEETVMNKVPGLRSICRSFELEDIDEILKEMGSETHFFMALNDVVNAISYPRYAPADCARAVESIRIAMSPDESNKKRAWKQMGTQLNLSGEYINFVSKLSAGPRHGDWNFIPEAQTVESIERSWTILDRFIAYVRGGKERLPASRFPQL